MTDGKDYQGREVGRLFLLYTPSPGPAPPYRQYRPSTVLRSFAPNLSAGAETG